MSGTKFIINLGKDWRKKKSLKYKTNISKTQHMETKYGVNLKPIVLHQFIPDSVTSCKGKADT